MAERDYTFLEKFLTVVDSRARVVLDSDKSSKFIDEKTREINDHFIPGHRSLYTPGIVLSVNTRNDLIEMNRWLDFHPEGIYTAGPLEEEPLVYSGEVVEKKQTGSKNFPHFYLVTKSKNPIFCLSPYPGSLQPYSRQVYTSGNVTWIDNRVNRIALEEKNSLPHTLIDLSDSTSLEQLKQRGLENYLALGRLTTIVPNQWYDSQNGEFSFQGYWPYSDTFNSKNESLDVHVQFKDDSRKFVGTFMTKEKLLSLFDRWKSSGERANGTYVPLDMKTMLVKNLSRNSIDKTITDLLKKEEFSNNFVESDPIDPRDN